MFDPVDEAVGRRQVTRLLCLSSGAGERRVKHQIRYSIQAKSFRANTAAQSKISHTAKVLSNQRSLNERPELEEKRASIGLYKGNRLSRKTGKVLRKKKKRKKKEGKKKEKRRKKKRKTIPPPPCCTYAQQRLQYIKSPSQPSVGDDPDSSQQGGLLLDSMNVAADAQLRAAVKLCFLCPLS